MEEQIKKNILDLHFQKYLTMISTSLIIAFTYLIGVFVAFVTNQINFDNLYSIFILIIFSIVVFGLCAIFFFRALFHIRRIPKILSEIKI